jgi:hypothetical protein
MSRNDASVSSLMTIATASIQTISATQMSSIRLRQTSTAGFMHRPKMAATPLGKYSVHRASMRK